MYLLASSLLVDNGRMKIIKKVHPSNPTYDQHVSYDVYQRAYFSPFTVESNLGFTKIINLEKKSIMKGIFKTEWWDTKLSNAEYEVARLDIDSSLTRD